MNRNKLTRRRLLHYSACCGGIALLGGVWTGQRLYGRSALKKTLIGEASSRLAAKNDEELTKLPPRAREEIRTYFHGICLNVSSFIEVVCSTTFGQRLAACASDAHKEQLLHVAFSQHVASSVEVTNRISVIAQEIGQDLDLRWQEACRALQVQWSAKLDASSRTAMNDLEARVQPYVVAQIAAARNSAADSLLDYTDAGDLAMSLGASAVRLIPIARIDPKIAIPIFLVTAIAPLWRYIIDRWNDRAGQAQFDITEKLSLLGNRVGAEFEAEVRQRIAQFQNWQQLAMEEYAALQAEKEYPLW